MTTTPVELDFNEDRADNIGQNAALGLHYNKPAKANKVINFLYECPLGCGLKNMNLGRETLSTHIRRSKHHKDVGPKQRQRILDKYYPRVHGKIHTPSVTQKESKLKQDTGLT